MNWEGAEPPFLPQLTSPSNCASAEKRGRKGGFGAEPLSSPRDSHSRGRPNQNSTHAMRPHGTAGSSSTVLRQAIGLTPNAMQRLTTAATDALRARKPSLPMANGLSVSPGGRQSVGRMERSRASSRASHRDGDTVRGAGGAASPRDFEHRRSSTPGPPGMWFNGGLAVHGAVDALARPTQPTQPPPPSHRTAELLHPPSQQPPQPPQQPPQQPQQPLAPSPPPLHPSLPHCPRELHADECPSEGELLPLSLSHPTSSHPSPALPRFSPPPPQQQLAPAAATPSPQPPQPPQPPRLRLPPGVQAAYHVSSMLGVGAFGTVWLATTRESGRRVAMKIVERKRQVRRSRRASEGLG
jgi:hypothetical protein